MVLAERRLGKKTEKIIGREKIMNYITGQQAWSMLQSLDYRGENSYRKFFENWDIFYRASWKRYPDKNGNIPEPERVEFHWIFNRDYNGHGVDKVESPPYWEICIGLPPVKTNMGGNYSPPRFIWNNKYGLEEIFLAPKINFEI